MTSTLSTWTVLPPLKLIDAGTANTESLSSYSFRLARLSGIPWTSFLALIDAESGSEAKKYVEHRRLDGPGPASLRRARSLERLTGQSLLGSTMNGVSEIVTGKAGSLHRFATWCPICVRGSGETDEKISRLIWNFSSYSHCSIHAVKLENTCPHCGNSKIRGLAPGNCLRCGGELNHQLDYGRPTREQSWTNHCIEELVAWTSRNPSELLQRSSLESFVQLVKEREGKMIRKYVPARSRRPSFSRYQRWVDAAVICRLGVHTSRIELNDLLRAAAQQCVSVLDMLLRPNESASELLPGLYCTPVLPPGRGPVADERLAFARLLEALLDAKFCVLPSIQELSLLRGKKGSFKSGLPGHHLRYAVQLRLQRAVIRQVAPHRINLAFRFAIQLQRSGSSDEATVEGVARQFSLAQDVAVGVMQSAKLAYEFRN